MVPADLAVTLPAMGQPFLEATTLSARVTETSTEWQSGDDTTRHVYAPVRMDISHGTRALAGIYERLGLFGFASADAAEVCAGMLVTRIETENAQS